MSREKQLRIKTGGGLNVNGLVNLVDCESETKPIQPNTIRDNEYILFNKNVSRHLVPTNNNI